MLFKYQIKAGSAGSEKIMILHGTTGCRYIINQLSRFVKRKTENFTVFYFGWGKFLLNV